MRGVSKANFRQNTLLQDSVIRRIEIIGEAAKRVSPATRQSLHDIPWTEITGMRDFMIHDYDDVDLEIVWDTVNKDLEPLITRLEPVVPQKKK